MSRTVRSRNIDKTPNLKPVEKVELSEKNLKLRIVLVVLLILVAAGSFAYGINAWLTRDAGWQKIAADSRGEANCSEEFVFLYNLGASGASATAENKLLISLYTDLMEKSYQLFHTKESFENVRNIQYINHHPNQEIEVDRMLYDAFEVIQESGNRQIYLGPVYVLYNNIFQCAEDYQLTDFDPYLNEELDQYYREVAAFASKPEMIDVELLGNNRIRLCVSEEYLSYAQENEITEFIDFAWMKNAFIVDHVAETMIQKGYTLGSISSYDGFCRNLDDTGTSYSFNIYDRTGQYIYPAGVMNYSGRKSIVYLRNYPTNSQDNKHYYALQNGEIRTPYLDMVEVRCKSVLNDFVTYSSEAGCAEVLMQTIPVYLTDTLDETAIQRMKDSGIYSVYCLNGHVLYNEETLEFIVS